MAEERSVDRLVTLVDAVVAIAITLLVLPLAEVPRTESGGPLLALPVLLALDLQPLIGFAISFVVIGRLWWSHHGIFRAVRTWSPAMVAWTAVWLFTIVLLPAATAIVPLYDPTTSPLPVVVYVGTMVLSGASLTVLAAIAHLDRSVAPEAGTETRNRLIGIGAATIAFVLALVIGVLVPAINLWALWLVAVTGPFEYVIRRAYRRRDAASSAV